MAILIILSVNILISGIVLWVSLKSQAKGKEMCERLKAIEDKPLPTLDTSELHTKFMDEYEARAKKNPHLRHGRVF